eukprot:4942929-Pleurochrysis_carterae.AAC.2
MPAPLSHLRVVRVVQNLLGEAAISRRIFAGEAELACKDGERSVKRGAHEQGSQSRRRKGASASKRLRSRERATLDVSALKCVAHP